MMVTARKFAIARCFLVKLVFGQFCSFTDSWTSGSSREGGVPRADIDPPIWLKKEQAYKLGSGSSDGSEAVSSSLSVVVEPSLLNVEGEDGSSEQLPVQPRKVKARTAFSEGQMNALTDRFNMQRYLTPEEMKTLAGLTGLTYKQVGPKYAG